MLFCFRRFQDCGKRIAKVHGADFFTLCCPYFCFVPCPVVTHTAAYCQIGPMSFCIQTTNAKVMENDLLHLDVLKCLEYIKLLVKTNHDLPTRLDEEEMRRVVTSSSRFEEMIIDKIKNETKL